MTTTACQIGRKGRRLRAEDGPALALRLAAGGCELSTMSPLRQIGGQREYDDQVTVDIQIVRFGQHAHQRLQCLGTFLVLDQQVDQSHCTANQAAAQ